MATYIEDEETSRLIDQYAKEQGKTKAVALGDLLRRELKQSQERSAKERYQAGLAYVVSAPTNGRVSDADIDSVYRYLHPD